MKIVACIILVSGILCAQQQRSKSVQNQNNLFKVEINIKDNSVKIIPPKNTDFEFPDEASKTRLIKKMDFNADGKKDIMVNLGACGTGGCMVGLFLNQNKNEYHLAFFDYLKSPEFIKDKNGKIIIKSYEEVEAYNPSKLHVSTYKYDSKKMIYKLTSQKIEVDEGK